MKNKNYYLIAYLVYFITLFALSINNGTNIVDNETSFNEDNQIELHHEITDPTEINEIEKIKTPKTSGAWVENPIFIDGDGAQDWAWAATQDWFGGGDGSQGDPYLLENITINAQKTSYYCIKIIDSTAHFEIRNCTLYNSIYIFLSGAIELENVQNGKIIDCNISNNVFGIMVEGGSNLIIANNTLNYNSNAGVSIAGGNNNIIIGNNASSCGKGIETYGQGDWNTIENNNLINNGNGFKMRGTTGSDNNIFRRNNVSFNYNGIYLELNNDYNTFSENIIANNTYGIYLTGSSPNYNDGNTFSNNLIAYNDYSVDIADSYCNDNHFYHNNFTQNKYNAIDDGTNNDWDNGYIGNYWHNYTGTDDDDDGCGTPAYDISGSAGKQDTLPFCDDGYDGGILHVDDDGYYSWNWEFSSTFDWCSGSGTASDPYIIEDLTIDASLGNGTFIQNSKDKYFIIRNCSIRNPSIVGEYPKKINGGIALRNTNKGQLYSNNLSRTTSSQYDAGISMYYSSEITIINNTLKGSTYGIFMRYCDENLIFNNTADYNPHVGIFLQCANHYNNITFNNASYNGIQGIALYDNCTNNRIENNIANSNAQFGIILTKQYTSYGSSYNFIANNSANDNGKGIHLSDFSNYNTITDNNCSFNTYCGILITSNSYRNIISNNRIENNYDYGIEITINSHDNNCTGNIIYNNEDYGVYMPDSNSDTNWFFNNNFTGNGNHVYDLGTNTKWNSAQIGNYWDDYFTSQGGVDADDDGVGDSDYLVYGTNYDFLPIWWDAPEVVFISPTENYQIGVGSPDFTISLEKAKLLTTEIWYRLWNGTVLTANSTKFSSETGTIQQSMWNLVGNGTVIITFFANDSRGFLTYTNLTVRKNIFVPVIIITSPTPNHISGFTTFAFTVELKKNINGDQLNKSWYKLYNGSLWTENIFFDTNGTIDQDNWSLYGDGPIWIYFYLNDTVPNLGSNSIEVYRDLIAPKVNISTPAPNALFGKESPSVTLDIIDLHFNFTKYRFYNGTFWSKNYTLSGTEGKLNQTGWEKSVKNGTLIIQFFTYDEGENLNITQITVRKDTIDPYINQIVSPGVGTNHRTIPPWYDLDITEPHFYQMWYTLDDFTNLYTSSTYTSLSGSINKALWDQLSNGNINITFYVQDLVGNEANKSVIVIKEVPSAILLPAADDDDDDDDDSTDWVIRAILAGIISGCVGITIRVAYGRVKKKREVARAAAAPSIILKKKYQIVHHDLLTPYGKVEKKDFRVGIAQVGLSKTGNLITELYEMTPEGLMRIREDMVDTVSANIKSMIESAHENKINILLFPEMTFDLNYKGMVKDVKKWAQEYDMYIITGGYHDIKTKQNICAIFGPEGIQWNQEKHTPATIHFGKKVFTEAIEIQHPPHKLHICATEYGRIAIAICRDFLDMDLRVEIKNCEPPVDLFFNPAYTPVIVDFEATHFDARRSVYAYTFFANVAEYGGTIINTPEKDRTKRQIPPKEEGLIFKDVDLFSLRSERKKWERRQSKEKRYIQSTRS